MLANYHTHTRYSDGKMEPREHITSAIEKGFAHLGFSEHSPVSFDNNYSLKYDDAKPYFALLDSLKKEYISQIGIYKALEGEYITGISENFHKLKADYGLDYIIGSVHLVRPEHSEELWFIDGSKQETYDGGLLQLFGNDIKKAVTTYFYQVNRMIENEKIDIIGHFDKIKMHNRDRYFSENDGWYKSLISETLELIKSKNIIIEVNTRGLYKKRSQSTYPGADVLKEIKALKLPVMLNSDAHHPDELDGYFQPILQLLKNTGFKELTIFDDTQGFYAIDIEKFV